MTPISLIRIPQRMLLQAITVLLLFTSMFAERAVAQSQALGIYFTYAASTSTPSSVTTSTSTTPYLGFHVTDPCGNIISDQNRIASCRNFTGQWSDITPDEEFIHNFSRSGAVRIAWENGPPAGAYRIQANTSEPALFAYNVDVYGPSGEEILSDHGATGLSEPRRVNYVADFEIREQPQNQNELTYKLCVVDGGNLIDDDIISVAVNQRSIFDNYILRGTERCETIQLERNPSRNTITVHAINEGSDPPNTAALRIRHATSNAVLDEGNWELSAGQRQEWDVYAISETEISLVPREHSVQRDAAQDTVAAVAAATVSNVTSNIGARFSAPNTGGVSISLAGMPVVFGKNDTHHSGWASLADPFDALGEDPWQSRHRSLTSDELLGSSSFEIPLGAAEGSNGNPADVGRQFTFWGRGDFQLFESGGGRNSGYDGDLFAGYLGADFGIGGSWLVGMALSRIKAEADYTLGSAGGGGTLEAELTNLHPYARFAVDDRSEAWAIFGLGKGDVTDSAQGASVSKSDLSMRMMSAGARHLLDSSTSIDWALLGDASLARVKTGEGVEAVDGISASVWRVRAGVEASYTTVWEGGSALTTFLEIAGRHDGGASAKGRGLEFSPGLVFSDPESGSSIEARGRALVLHSADNHREYGASLTASLASGADGTGLSLTITPTWGAPTNSHDSVDANLFRREVVRSRADSLSLNSRVAYGIAAGSGLLSPFAEFSLHDSDSHRLRVGSRYSLDPSVDLELSGDRTSDGTGSAGHSVQFRARIGF